MAPAYSAPLPADNCKQSFAESSRGPGWASKAVVIAISIVGVLSILTNIIQCILRCRQRRRARRELQDGAAERPSTVGAIGDNIELEDNPSRMTRIKDRVSSLGRSESDEPVPAPPNHRTREPPRPILKKPTPSNTSEAAPNDRRDVSLSTILSSLFHTDRTRGDSTTDYTKSESDSDEESVKSSPSSTAAQAVPPVRTVSSTNGRFYGLFPHFNMRKDKDTPAGEEFKTQCEPVSPLAIQSTTAPALHPSEDPLPTHISSLSRDSSQKEYSKGKQSDGSFASPKSHDPNPPASLNLRPSTDSSRHGFIPSIFSRRKHNSSDIQDFESHGLSSPTTIQLQTPPATPDLRPNQQANDNFLSLLRHHFIAQCYGKRRPEQPQAEPSFRVDRAVQNNNRSWIQQQEQIRHNPVGDGLQKVSISPLQD